MRRGTTPTLTATVNADLTAFSTVHLAFKQEGRDVVVYDEGALEVSGYDAETGETKVSCTMSQEDTLALKSGKALEVQLRAVDAGGNAIATTIGRVDVKRILEEGVIGDG